MCQVNNPEGSRYVLRRFKDNDTPHSALVRMQRECWVLEQLAQVGAPVPLQVARCAEPGAEATLTTFVIGEHLGTIIPTLTPVAAAAAWSSCGRALARVHSVDGPRAAAAECERAGINNPTATRGPWHYEESLRHLERLAVARCDLGSLSELERAVRDALPLYERAPIALCQCDAHLWQFLVAPWDEGEWRCAAILDWEHADLDDPDWDVAQLDGFRWAELDLVPAKFFAGYGRVPTSPLHTLYQLERAAWILSAHAAGEHEWLELSIPLAERLLRGLLARPQGLRERISRTLAKS